MALEEYRFLVRKNIVKSFLDWTTMQRKEIVVNENIAIFKDEKDAHAFATLNSLIPVGYRCTKPRPTKEDCYHCRSMLGDVCTGTCECTRDDCSSCPYGEPVTEEYIVETI